MLADATKEKQPASKEAATAGDPVKPVATYRSGSISVAVFPKGTISLRRSFKTKEGAWKNTHTLWAKHLPDAIKALSECLAASAEPSDDGDAEE